MTKSDNTSREKEIYKVTLCGGAVNLLLLVFKFVAGVTAHSSAMIADAVHSLSDFVTDIVVIAFVRISGKPQDEDHEYGHGKYETFATALIGAALLIVGIGIFADSASGIVGFMRGERLEAPGMLAFVAALVSVLSKEAVYRYTVIKGRRLNSKAVIANAWHHRSDALSSVGTMAGIGGAIFLGDTWRVLDPLAALVVSLFVVRVAWQLVKPSIDELLEKSLPKDMEDSITAVILSFKGVRSPHHLRTRYIGNTIAIEVHIRLDGSMTLSEAHDITKRIEAALKEKFGERTHIGIHMEPWK